MKITAIMTFIAAFAATSYASASEMTSPAYISQINYVGAASLSMAEIAAPAIQISQAIPTLNAGRGNLSLISQEGQFNTATIEQFGARNVGLIRQIGYANSASIMQSGVGHRALVAQSGSNNVAIIRQRSR